MILPRFSFTTKVTLVWLLDGATACLFNQPYVYGGQMALIPLFFWNKATWQKYLYCFFLFATSVCIHVEPFEASLLTMILCLAVAEFVKLFVVYSPQGRCLATVVVLGILNGFFGWTIMQFVVNLIMITWIIQRSS